MKFKFCHDYEVFRKEFINQDDVESALKSVRNTVTIFKEFEKIKPLMDDNDFLHYLININNNNNSNKLNNEFNESVDEIIDKCKNLNTHAQTDVTSENSDPLIDLVRKFREFAIDYENSKKILESQQNSRRACEINELIAKIKEYLRMGSTIFCDHLTSINNNDINIDDSLYINNCVNNEWHSIVRIATSLINTNIEDLSLETCAQVLNIISDIVNNAEHLSKHSSVVGSRSCSRTGSRNDSINNSRVCSRSTSPNTSPNLLKSHSEFFEKSEHSLTNQHPTLTEVKLTTKSDYNNKLTNSNDNNRDTKPDYNNLTSTTDGNRDIKSDYDIGNDRNNKHDSKNGAQLHDNINFNNKDNLNIYNNKFDNNIFKDIKDKSKNDNLTLNPTIDNINNKDYNRDNRARESIILNSKQTIDKVNNTHSLTNPIQINSKSIVNEIKPNLTFFGSDLDLNKYNKNNLDKNDINDNIDKNLDSDNKNDAHAQLENSCDVSQEWVSDNDEPTLDKNSTDSIFKTPLNNISINLNNDKNNDNLSNSLNLNFEKAREISDSAQKTDMLVGNTAHAQTDKNNNDNKNINNFTDSAPKNTSKYDFSNFPPFNFNNPYIDPDRNSSLFNPITSSSEGLANPISGLACSVVANSISIKSSDRFVKPESVTASPQKTSTPPVFIPPPSTQTALPQISTPQNIKPSDIKPHNSTPHDFKPPSFAVSIPAQSTPQDQKTETPPTPKILQSVLDAKNFSSITPPTSSPNTSNNTNTSIPLSNISPKLSPSKILDSDSKSIPSDIKISEPPPLETPFVPLVKNETSDFIPFKMESSMDIEEVNVKEEESASSWSPQKSNSKLEFPLKSSISSFSNLNNSNINISNLNNINNSNLNNLNISSNINSISNNNNNNITGFETVKNDNLNSITPNSQTNFASINPSSLSQPISPFSQSISQQSQLPTFPSNTPITTLATGFGSLSNKFTTFNTNNNNLTNNLTNFNAPKATQFSFDTGSMPSASTNLSSNKTSSFGSSLTNFNLNNNQSPLTTTTISNNTLLAKPNTFSNNSNTFGTLTSSASSNQSPLSFSLNNKNSFFGNNPNSLTTGFSTLGSNNNQNINQSSTLFPSQQSQQSQISQQLNSSNNQNSFTNTGSGFTTGFNTQNSTGFNNFQSPNQNKPNQNNFMQSLGGFNTLSLGNNINNTNQSNTNQFSNTNQGITQNPNQTSSFNTVKPISAFSSPSQTQSNLPSPSGLFGNFNNSPAPSSQFSQFTPQNSSQPIQPNNSFQPNSFNQNQSGQNTSPFSIPKNFGPMKSPNSSFGQAPSDNTSKFNPMPTNFGSFSSVSSNQTPKSVSKSPFANLIEQNKQNQGRFS